MMKVAQAPSNDSSTINICSSFSIFYWCINLNAATQNRKRSTKWRTKKNESKKKRTICFCCCAVAFYIANLFYYSLFSTLCLHWRCVFFFRSRSLSPIYSFAKRQNLSIKRYMFINRMRGKKKHFIRLLNGKSANKAGKAKLLVQ